MVGIRQIAERAEVSTATVNRVIRGNGPVSPERRKRVLAAIAELDYVPNAAARALTRGRSNLLGLFVPDIANPFYAQVAKGLEDRAAEDGFRCVISSSDFDPARELELMTMYRDGTLAGLAISPLGSAADLGLQKQGARVPHVFIDRRADGSAAPLVGTSNRATAREAVSSLLEQGHRRIAMISGPRNFETAAQRIAGYQDALRRYGAPVEPGLVLQGYIGERGGREAMEAVLDQEPRPTAVFSFNNLLTIGALAAVRARGVRMPDELSLVTFDDMSLFAYVDPPITAIAQPSYDIGRAAADLLVRRLEGDERATGDITLPARLIGRGSTAPPAPAGRPAPAPPG